MIPKHFSHSKTLISTFDKHSRCSNSQPLFQNRLNFSPIYMSASKQKRRRLGKSNDTVIHISICLAIYQLCQSVLGRDKQGQAGTRQGQTGTNKDKQSLSLSFPVCRYLSMLVPFCPCLSLSAHVCPCLSLSVNVCPCLSMSFPVYPCP